jgi:uncharacterized protein (DUF1015 family)
MNELKLMRFKNQLSTKDQMRIRVFQGLRPTPASVAEVVSLPYDVVSTAEARAMAEGKPNNMLRVVRAEINFAEGMDPYADAVYEKAVERFEAMQAAGALVRETAPCLYIYQQQMGDHIQRGITALCHVEDYEQDLIKKHERTRVAKENDRTRLTADMSANAGPVFLTFKQNQLIDSLVTGATQSEPLFDHLAEDGIRHTVWRLLDADPVVEAFKEIPCCYVADGHHRAASAARVGKERRAANPSHTGEEDYNWFMTVLFPANQLQILPYNRLVNNLNGYSVEAFLLALKKIAEVTLTILQKPSKPGEVCCYLKGQWYHLKLPEPVDSDPVSRLDVSVLQEQILAPLLGIADPRTNEDIEFVGGIRGTQYLQDAVDSGEAAIAFSMYPVLIEQLMDIADAGQVMAPKSTWFEPKLRSGFFIHTF